MVRYGYTSKSCGCNKLCKTVEDHQGIKIAALEEIGFINGWINKETLIESGDQCSKMAMVNIY